MHTWRQQSPSSSASNESVAFAFFCFLSRCLSSALRFLSSSLFFSSSSLSIVSFFAFSSSYWGQQRRVSVPPIHSVCVTYLSVGSPSQGSCARVRTPCPYRDEPDRGFLQFLFDLVFHRRGESVGSAKNQTCCVRHAACGHGAREYTSTVSRVLGLGAVEQLGRPVAHVEGLGGHAADLLPLLLLLPPLQPTTVSVGHGRVHLDAHVWLPHCRARGGGVARALCHPQTVPPPAPVFAFPWPPLHRPG